jgi:thiol-disulfide isomerase/thioredoxin
MAQHNAGIWIQYVFITAVSALFIGGYVIISNPPQPSTPKALLPPEGTVMFFFSEYCHFCQEQKPIVERLVNESYNLTWMDVGIHSEYLNNYSIQSTPTFLASNGDRKVGLMSYEDLKAWLDQHGAKAI